MTGEVSGEPGTDLVEQTADYVGAGFADSRAACRAALRSTPALHYVAHHSHKRCDFSIDAFGGGRTPPREFDRPGLCTLSLRLSSEVCAIDDTLQEAGTGELIRTVLRARHFAVCCNSVVPGERIVGFSFPSGDAQLADERLSTLATELRRLQSRGTQNPGGYESEPSRRAPVQLVRDPVVDVFAQVDDDVAKACNASVRPDDLHVMAYCADGELRLIADQLDHPAMARFYPSLRVGRLRSFYRDFAPELAVVAANLSQIVGEAGGLLMSLVLDVEQGAIYYRRLPSGHYLMGVTIDQHRVRDADMRTEELALRLQAAPLIIAERTISEGAYSLLSATDQAS
ncbi:hypothetical protein JOF56_006671 [Kibdelosporangium banguiense]|uniref:GAF domain-containing protein n=1 Tax=Kibdelosporangium banguiense TaxID=1365924 RepID=A0ABS4TPG1_9PSEU|nr:hypothetical protein [Kibdelosporangium banguiense]MBP2326286.1 hypothetical protein [Kibdelosporangium banguiense]